jgi:hypothetical protein
MSEFGIRAYEPADRESILVAAPGGRVVGYLTGCVDTERSRGAAAREVRRLIRRGGLRRPGFACFLGRVLVDVVRDRGAPAEALFDARWPAHLHIDFLPEARGQGLGRRMHLQRMTHSL